jgi:capsular polysaccharide biosynthesis protein
MLIKTSSDKYVFSANRCMNKLDDTIIEEFNKNNIKILSINDFKNIYEYICVFYHAKNIIVSYGGVACTNRFFCNKNANIILIANLHYKYEYEYEYDNTNQLYWHLRHSHIFPAKKQTVLLEFENNINNNNINDIINLLE